MTRELLAHYEPLEIVNWFPFKAKLDSKLGTTKNQAKIFRGCGYTFCLISLFCVTKRFVFFLVKFGIKIIEIRHFRTIFKLLRAGFNL